MKANMFLPEIVLKVLEINKKNAILKCINDKGEKVTVFILDKNKKPTKEEFENFIEKKAQKAVSKTIVDTLVETLSRSKIAEEIEEKIISQNPEIVRKPREFVKILNNELTKKATEIAKSMYMLDKGMIIKIGGITNKDGTTISARIDFDLSNNKNPGFYILSVPNDKNPMYRRIPIKLIPLKESNKYKAVTNSAFATIDDIRKVLKGFLKTLKAYEEKKVNAKPTISFTVLKSRNPTKEELELTEKIKHYNEISRNGEIDFNKAVKLLKDIVSFVDKNNLANKIEIFIPLEPLSIKVKDFLQETKEKMIRTSFSNSLSLGKIKIDDIDKIFKEAMDNSNPVLLTTYKFKEDGYGFFKERINLNSLSPHSSFYEKIIEKEKELIYNRNTQKTINKEKNFQSPLH